MCMAVHIGMEAGVRITWTKGLMLALAVASVAVASVLAYRYLGPQEKPVLTVFHAGSLTVPMEEIADAFEELYGVEVHLEAYGSVAAVRQVTDLGRKCDVLALADYKPILELMWPDLADWCILFATNEMVLAYTEQSACADQIGPGNWYDILCREGVSFGRADPVQDPCGYRTLLVWRLAEAFYNQAGLYDRLLARSPEPTRPKSHDLVVLLENGQLDYAFMYKSVAVQYGLKYVDLPPQIDLGHEEYADFYSTASVWVEGLGEVRGEPIRYAITIPKVAEEFELALKFVKLVLGEEGMGIIEDCGQNPIRPCLAIGYENVPRALKPYVVEWTGHEH